MLTSGKSDPPWGIGFVQHLYLLRALGCATSFLPLFWLLRLQHSSVWLTSIALGFCFIWPHVAYLRVRHAAQPLLQEHRNLLCDSAWGGWLIVSVHFAPVATVVIPLMFALHNMAVGGWRLFATGLAAICAGLAVGIAMLGVSVFRPDPLVDLSWLPLVIVYPLVLAKSMHDVSVKLLDRSIRLRELNERDSLTGLINRDTVFGKLQSILADANRTHQPISVLFIDLDGFKTINDALGHRAGDLLLVAIAGRLAACVKEGDVAARYGGDEFVIVARGESHDAQYALLDAVQAGMMKPVNVGGHELVIGASVGISVFPADGSDAETLICAADAAMYSAKSRGRNCYEFYRAEMHTSAHMRLLLSTRLRKAIETGALQLHYQPQVDMRNGELCGFEALVRWHDDLLGDIAPADFVPLAETSGLVCQLGEWVMQEACSQAACWTGMGIKPVRISINLSPLHLQRPDIVESFCSIMRETGVRPWQLELEVTETALMRQPETAIHRLHEFRRSGVSIAIDDFGVGYSSLGRLIALPVDRLKVDRAFVSGIGAGDTGAIATAIVTLAKTLDLAVIAEGVETQAQQSFLLGVGCFEAQGFLYSTPLDASSTTRLLLDGGALPVLPSGRHGSEASPSAY